MNSVPLIQKVDKDSINTTIIALKKAINEIESVLGLDSGSEIDTSVFVKKSEVVDAVEADNLNPVTSNAVADYTVDRIEVNNSQPVTSNAVSKAFELSPIETISITTSNQTAQYDGYLFIYVLGNTETSIVINNEILAVLQTPSSYDSSVVIPISKGDTFRVNNTTSVYWCKARWYKYR